MNIAYSYTVALPYGKCKNVATFHINNATLHYILSSCILFPAIPFYILPHHTIIIHRFETSPPTATCMHSHPHLSAMPPLSVTYVTMPCTPYII